MLWWCRSSSARRRTLRWCRAFRFGWCRGRRSTPLRTRVASGVMPIPRPKRWNGSKWSLALWFEDVWSVCYISNRLNHKLPQVTQHVLSHVFRFPPFRCVWAALFCHRTFGRTCPQRSTWDRPANEPNNSFVCSMPSQVSWNSKLQLQKGFCRKNQQSRMILLPSWVSWHLVLELLDVFTIPSLITPFEGALCGGACFTLAVFVLVKDWLAVLVLVKDCLGAASCVMGSESTLGKLQPISQI